LICELCGRGKLRRRAFAVANAVLGEQGTRVLDSRRYPGTFNPFAAPLSRRELLVQVQQEGEGLQLAYAVTVTDCPIQRILGVTHWVAAGKVEASIQLAEVKGVLFLKLRSHLP